MKRYEGCRKEGVFIVKVDGRPLVSRLELRNHSPTGFECGYGGSGPAQLALAIVADHLGDDERALAVYQDFKFAVVAGLPRDGWILNSEQVERALESIQAK